MSIAKKLERLLQTKKEIKAAIESKGVIVAQNEPFRNYPAKIAAIQGGGAITLAEYDMSALQDNSVIGYLEAVPEGYVQVRIEGTGAMMDYSGQSPLQQNPMLKKIIVKEGVTSIGGAAFQFCESLTEIVIPDSVTSIGNFAFEGCTSLTEIVIPDSVTSIGDSAFNRCSGLTSVIIPDSVTTIGEWAFASCTSLTEIVIPDSVTTIGDFAFAFGNPNLILKPEVLEKPEGWDIMWNAYDFGETFLTVWWGGVEPEPMIIATFDLSQEQDESITAALYDDGRLIIAGAGAIKDNQDWGEYKDFITLVEIQEGVTSIGNFAFEGCTSLTEIVIPDSVTSIGDFAFASCTSLTEIIIPNSVTTIGDYAFAEGNPDLILKPEVLEKPEGWSDMWNAYDWWGTFLTVWWGGIQP